MICTKEFCCTNKVLIILIDYLADLAKHINLLALSKVRVVNVNCIVLILIDVHVGIRNNFFSKVKNISKITYFCFVFKFIENLVIKSVQ